MMRYHLIISKASIDFPIETNSVTSFTRLAIRKVYLYKARIRMYLQISIDTEIMTGNRFSKQQ